MGKTKTAIISGLPGEKELSGAEKYKIKQAKKAAAEAGPGEAKSKRTVKGVGLKGGERMKVIGADLPVKEETAETTAGLSPKAKRGPRVRGNKHAASVAKIDNAKLYPMAEAVKLAKETSYSKFDGTMELHAVVKKEGISTQVTLPHSAGKKKKIEIADEATIKKLEAGKIDFDVLLATGDMMPKLVKYARLLGPKGLMPNPKNGTVIKTVSDAKKFSENAVTIKTQRKAPLIHTTIGKVSQPEKELVANAESVLKAISKNQLVKVYVCASMGPSVKVKV